MFTQLVSTETGFIYSENPKEHIIYIRDDELSQIEFLWEGKKIFKNYFLKDRLLRILGLPHFIIISILDEISIPKEYRFYNDSPACLKLKKELVGKICERTEIIDYYKLGLTHFEIIDFHIDSSYDNYYTILKKVKIKFKKDGIYLSFNYKDSILASLFITKIPLEEMGYMNKYSLKLLHSGLSDLNLAEYSELELIEYFANLKMSEINVMISFEEENDHREFSRTLVFPEFKNFRSMYFYFQELKEIRKKKS